MTTDFVVQDIPVLIDVHIYEKILQMIYQKNKLLIGHN